MAYRELMRFEKAHARWKKMVQGHRYVVTCAELDAPKTREGSRQAANEWIEARLLGAGLRAGTLEPQDEEENRKIQYAREKAPERFKIRTSLENFLTEARRNKKPSTAGELRKYLNLIIREAGIWTPESDIRSVTNETVTKFVSWLFHKNYQPGTHNKVLGFFKRFVREAFEEGELETTPRNLYAKKHRKRQNPEPGDYESPCHAIFPISNIVNEMP